jgi:hypothetical protein
MLKDIPRNSGKCIGKTTKLNFKNENIGIKVLNLFNIDFSIYDGHCYY